MGYSTNLKEVALKVAASEKKNTGRPRTVVFTHGSKSTIVAYDGKVFEYAVKPLAKEELVDTNGAGDAFVGGFLASLLAGKDMDQNIEAGHWAARFIIQQSGCQLSTPCTFNFEDGRRALLLED